MFSNASLTPYIPALRQNLDTQQVLSSPFTWIASGFTLSLIGTVALFRNLLPPKDYYDREMAAAVEAIPTSVQDAVVRDVSGC